MFATVFCIEFAFAHKNELLGLRCKQKRISKLALKKGLNLRLRKQTSKYKPALKRRKAGFEKVPVSKICKTFGAKQINEATDIQAG